MICYHTYLCMHIYYFVLNVTNDVSVSKALGR
jgi:hypothetical protein